MTLSKLLVIGLLLTRALSLSASVYGSDDRQLQFDIQNITISKVSRSIAAKLRERPMELNDNLSFIISKPLKTHIKNLCPGEKFENIQTFSNCTGFVVGKNLMLTAGHCINNEEECHTSSWLFSSSLDPYSTSLFVDRKTIVKCQKIVNRIKSSFSKNDYTLFKISSLPKEAKPLKFRKKGRIDSESQLFVIGHPTGLPLTHSGEAQILENNSDFIFKINSDTFGGNSGSPVFNLDSGLVEGILSDGALDYKKNTKKSCSETYHCKPDNCQGEVVVRITNIPELVPGMTPEEPIFDPEKPIRL